MGRVMNYAPGAQLVTRVSSEDLSAKGGYACTLDAAGTVSLSNAATESIFGIIVDGGSASGDPCTICLQGICQANAGTAINEWEALTAESGGQVIDTTTTGDYVVGHALSDAADGDFFDVLVGGGHNRYAATS